MSFTSRPFEIQSRRSRAAHDNPSLLQLLTRRLRCSKSPQTYANIPKEDGNMLSKSSAVTVCQQCKPPARRVHGEGQTELRYAHCSYGPGAPLREPMEWNTHHRSREVTKVVDTIRSPFCGREDACGRRVGSTDTGSVAVYAACAHHNPIHSQISEECAVSLVLLHRL
jgi:hypothetical protein